MMNNIKQYRDGDRYILVVENCTGETARIINELIIKLVGVEPVKIDGLEALTQPPTDTTPDIPAEEINDAVFDQSTDDGAEFVPMKGRCSGMTFDEAFRKYGSSAAVDFFLAMREKHVSGDLFVRVKKIMSSNWEERDSIGDSLENINEFLMLHKPLLIDLLEHIRNRVGYQSIEDYIDFASDKELRGVYKCALDYLKNSFM